MNESIENLGMIAFCSIRNPAVQDIWMLSKADSLKSFLFAVTGSNQSVYFHFHWFKFSSLGREV